MATEIENVPTVKIQAHYPRRREYQSDNTVSLELRDGMIRFDGPSAVVEYNAEKLLDAITTLLKPQGR